MRKMHKRIGALLLCGALVFSSLPSAISASGATTDTFAEVETVSENDATTESIISAETETTTPPPSEAETTYKVTFVDETGTEVFPGLTVKRGDSLMDTFADMTPYRAIKEGRRTESFRYSYYPKKGEIKEKTLKLYGYNKFLNDKGEPYAFYADTQFTLQYSDDLNVYNVNYHLDGGRFPDNASSRDYYYFLPDSENEDVEADALIYPESFRFDCEDIPLVNPVKKGFVFDGWYTDEALTQKTTMIPSGTDTSIDGDGSINDYELYAKWISAAPDAPTVNSAKNPKTGVVKITLTLPGNAEGTVLEYSTDKKFKKSVFEYEVGKKTSITLKNFPKGKTYYFRARSYVADSTDAQCFSTYSKNVTCKVTKGVKEVAAKSNSAKLNSIKVENGNLVLRAKVSKRIKSSDDCYYIVSLDPRSGAVKKAVAYGAKDVDVAISTPIRDEKGTNLIEGKYALAIKDGKKYKTISASTFIDNPEDAATYTAAFPKPASKKGSHGTDELLNGSMNYYTDVWVGSLIGSKGNGTPYKYNGKTYYFHTPSFPYLSAVHEIGGTYTVGLNLNFTGSSKKIIKKSALKGKSFGKRNEEYYAYNVEDAASRETVEALFNFLAEEGTSEDAHVDNWILGNEVNTTFNSTALWYYSGSISQKEFMENYASTFRILYYAVKSHNKNGRVYICTDHTWINRGDNDIGTSTFMKLFNSEIKSQNNNIKWNLAYHAYSSVLTNADFWNDGNLAPNSQSADFVSPKNLNVLTDFVKENFGKDTRIILSEQGFSRSGGVGSPYNAGRQTGENVQAAAIAYLYYKVQFNDMIDAVHINNLDHGGAGFQFGYQGKKADKVYKYMDTPDYAKYTKDCLSTLGASSWSNLVGGFSDKKLKKMPKRK